ncbi:efflux RND transporter periplasmic adaptor subunit [Oceanimonas sp. CHS3-5]|uniref:efflux RND transporter periplasmic adaptor subunit n=1 Tax=Oceanimonas sp. CHS3-5 TaxID=3068186 RepID=UPI00273D85F6|nr:efflux RND transporter periplasmic adaptor subunit [Oceanimonas sp. CHS3-5]MDP5291259.1 efflux RND transporter periplasmic adaptor subunit [Oceanimonas sp. CHS3-5]
MRSRLLWSLAGLLALLPMVALLLVVKLAQFSAMAEAEEQMTLPPERVNAIAVREYQWQPQVRAVGSVAAVRGAVLRTEAEGVVAEVAFTAGAGVKAGEVLFRLNDDIERAQLNEATAAAELARLSYQRARTLRSSGSLAQGDLDEARSRYRQASARQQLIEAQIAKKTLRAPFAGQLGIRRISPGQFLEKGSAVVSLQSLDPVLVDFSLPQQRLAGLRAGLPVVVTADAWPGRTFDGEVSAVDPELDAGTRSVRGQASLTNPDGALRPGMFVQLTLTQPQAEALLLVPLTAIIHGPDDDAVLVIEPGEGESRLLRRQLVRLGRRLGDFVAVTEGLNAGQQVVSTGVFKLFPGMEVVVDNRLAPAFSLDPQPDNG